LETLKSGNRFQRVEKLLFPGYIFVRCDIHSQDIRTLNATMGLSRVVRGLGSGPGILPDAFVVSLMVACGHGGMFKDQVTAGQKVRIFDGPFVGLVGKVMSADANGRLRILIDLISGARTLSVDTNAVEIVNG
jgi:transcriptional antiterminator RfaH